jgi:hypothetical protein
MFHLDKSISFFYGAWTFCSLLTICDSSRAFKLDPHPYVQWITSDSNGNIWMAEQLAGSLGHIRIEEDRTVNNQKRCNIDGSTIITYSLVHR